MTGTNHVAIGAIIGATVSPALALPAAFASHFVADTLPHFGIPNHDDRKKPKYIRLFLAVLKVDVITMTTLLIWFALNAEWIVTLSAFAAFSPDIAWIYRYIFTEKWGKLPPRPRNRFNEFHFKIQKYEFPLGILLEVPLAIALVISINRLV
ncbi:MAG: hypothetical protein M3Q70_00450 [bacterium]|nr:hypothetical protein [bacterium]